MPLGLTITDVGAVTLIAAGIAAAVSLLTLWVTGVREARERRRRSYAGALTAVVAYREFPYAVRRRRDDVPGEERVRLSEALREVQRELAFSATWIELEGSTDTCQAFTALVAETRKVAGGYIREAWKADPVKNDEDMNITGIDYSTMPALESAYLAEVKKDLSWFRVWRRW